MAPLHPPGGTSCLGWLRDPPAGLVHSEGLVSMVQRSLERTGCVCSLFKQKPDIPIIETQLLFDNLKENFILKGLDRHLGSTEKHPHLRQLFVRRSSGQRGVLGGLLETFPSSVTYTVVTAPAPRRPPCAEQARTAPPLHLLGGGRVTGTPPGGRPLCSWQTGPQNPRITWELLNSPAAGRIWSWNPCPSACHPQLS